MKRFLMFMAVIMLSLNTIDSMYAQSTSNKSLNELQKEKNEITTDKKEAEQKLNENQSQQKTLFEEIQQLDDEITSSEEALLEITDSLSETILDLSQAEDDLIKATEKKEFQIETYKERLNAMYENGSISYWQVLFASENFADFFNRLEYISDIIGHDQNMLEDLAATEQLINNQLDLITKQKVDIEFLREAEQQRKATLEYNRLKKDEFMAALVADEELYAQQVEELEKASDDIETLIKKKQAEEEAARKAAAAKKAAEEAAKKAAAQKAAAEKAAAQKAAAEKAAAQKAAAEKAAADKSTTDKNSTSTNNTQTTYTGGKMTWPVPGHTKTSSDYENRTHPITGKKHFHSGIDIPAPKGTKVVAASDGVVITSGSQSGYGLTIIIDHGGGIYTLYGHNSKLTAKVGQTVKRGDKIAEIGSTGVSTGNHCHFEVRINGAHTSPWAYLK